MIHEKVNGSHPSVAREVLSRPARKPRVQGLIANLSAAQREQIHEWIRENLTYKAMAARIAQHWNIKIVPSSLCAYYHKHAFEIFRATLAPARDEETSHTRVVTSTGPFRLTITIEVEQIAPAKPTNRDASGE